MSLINALLTLNRISMVVKNNLLKRYGCICMQLGCFFLKRTALNLPVLCHSDIHELEFVDLCCI